MLHQNGPKDEKSVPGEGSPSEIMSRESFDQQMLDISKQCANSIDGMVGSWVIPKNAYEKDFCSLLGWKCHNGRYSDARMGDTFIEIKKGQGMMWFDMVRYAEIFMGKGRQQTMTIFIRYDKLREYVRDIYIIDTQKIVAFLKMTSETSAFCIQLHGVVPRGLNMQASATNKDMRAMAQYVITSTREKERNQSVGKKRSSKSNGRGKCPKRRKKKVEIKR
mgnify:FL=1